MKKITFWAILGLVGVIADELTKASADGKITVKEALKIVEVVCDRLGIDFDKAGFDLAKEKFERGE